MPMWIIPAYVVDYFVLAEPGFEKLVTYEYSVCVTNVSLESLSYHVANQPADQPAHPHRLISHLMNTNTINEHESRNTVFNYKLCTSHLYPRPPPTYRDSRGIAG